MMKNNGWRGLPGALTVAAIIALTQTPGTVSAASGPERFLAGIHIFDPGSEVTKKFGNPSRILVGGAAPGAASTLSGGAGASGGVGSSGSSLFSGSSANGTSGAGLLPGFAGIANSYGNAALGSEFPGAPSAPGPSGFPGAAGGIAAAPAGPVKQPVTLIYDRANGGSLEFTISPDKRVVQIRETGYTGAYGTARGLKLGTSYANVVRLYGYPENTIIDGAVIDTDYKDTLHCGFQFLDQKLVGIIIASPD